MVISALDANRALTMTGQSYRVPEPAAAASLAGASCLTCHTPPTQTWNIYGVAFNHAAHSSQPNVDCTWCHTSAPPEQPEHGRVALRPEDCRACHASRLSSSPHPDNWRAIHGPQVPADRQSCDVCHDSSWCARCHGVTLPHPSDWPTVHGTSALQRPDVCRQCHQPNMCSNCHGLPIPHPGNWLQKHVTTYRTNTELCWKCHPQQECARCHGLAMPHPADWVDTHGKTAESGAAICARCHTSKDCLTCHQGNPPPSHDHGWDKQHPVVGKKSGDLCKLCHSASKGDVCTTCHGIPMPHPDDFATNHTKVASFDKKAVCFRCHDRKKFCGQCHDNTG
jgi:hypothetical protein